MQRANSMTSVQEIVDLSSILDEVFKKKNEVEKQVEIARQDLEKVELQHQNGDKQFQQAKASLILSHEMVRHDKYYQIMEKYSDYKPLFAANMSDEIVRKKREALYLRKKLLENKIAENRRQINMNLQTETKLKEEILILRKRNNALLIRLQRQLHEAQCRCRQAEDRLTHLKMALEEQEHLIQKNQIH